MNKNKIFGFCIFLLVFSLFFLLDSNALDTNVSFYNCSFYDEGTFVRNIHEYNDTININGSLFDDGNYSFSCLLRDTAGNEEQISNKYYIKDSVNPRVTYQVNRSGTIFDFYPYSDNSVAVNDNSPENGVFYFSPNDILIVYIDDTHNGDNFSSGVKNITYDSTKNGDFFNNLKSITIISETYDNFDKRKQYIFEIPLVNVTQSTQTTQNYNFSLNITDYSGNSKLENFTFVLDNETPEVEFINITCIDRGVSYNDTIEDNYEVSCDKVKFYFNISNEKDIDINSIIINSDVGVFDSRDSSFNNVTKVLMIYVDLNDVLNGVYKNFTLKARIFDYAENMNETNFSFSVDKKAPEINITYVSAGTSLFLNGKHHIFYSSNHFNITFNLSEEANCTLNTDSPTRNYLNTITDDNITHSIVDIDVNDVNKYKPLVCQDMVGNSFSQNFVFNPDVNPPTIDNFRINAIKSPRTEFIEIISSNGNEQMGSFTFETVDSIEGGADYSRCVYYGEKFSGHGNESLNYSTANGNSLFTEDYSINHNYEFTDILMNLSNISIWDSVKISGNYSINISCTDASGQNLSEEIKNVNFTVNLNEFDIIDVNPEDEGMFYSKENQLKIDVFFNKNESITCNLTNSSSDIVSIGQFYFEHQNNKAFVFYNLSRQGEHNLTISCKKLQFDRPSTRNIIYTLDLSAPNINISNLTKLNYSNLTSGYNNHNSTNYEEEEFLTFETRNILINMIFNDNYTNFINLTMRLNEYEYTPDYNFTYNKTYNYTFNRTVLQDGKYTFTVIASDGHHQNRSDIFVLVDTKDPAINEGSVTNRTFGNKNYNISFDIENENSDTLKKVWVSINESNYSANCVYDSIYKTFNCNTFLNLSEGLNNVTIHVEDYLGNNDSFSFNTTKDSSVGKPSFAGIEVISGTYIKDSVNNYTISSDIVRLNITIDSSEYYRKIETILNGSAIEHDFDKNADWNWSNNIDLKCNDGQSKTLELKVTDIYGNTNSTFINIACDFTAPSLELKTKTIITKTGKFDFGIFTNDDFDRAELTVHDSNYNEIGNLAKNYSSSNIKENTLIHTSRLNKSTKYSDNYVVVNGNIADVVSNYNYVSFNVNEIKYLKIKSLEVQQTSPSTYVTKVYLDNDNIIRDKYPIGKEIKFYGKEYPNNMIYVEDFDITADGIYYIYVVAYDDLNNSNESNFIIEKNSNLQLEIDVKSPIYDTYPTDEGNFKGYLVKADDFAKNSQINIIINVTPEFNAICKLYHKQKDILGFTFEEHFERIGNNEYRLTIGQDKCVTGETFNNPTENSYLCKLGGGFIKTNFTIKCIDEEIDSNDSINMSFAIMDKTWSGENKQNKCQVGIYQGDYCYASAINGTILDLNDQPKTFSDVNITLKDYEYIIANISGNSYLLAPLKLGVYTFDLTNDNYFIEDLIGNNVLNSVDVKVELSNHYYPINISIGKYAHLNINATNPNNFNLKINSSKEKYNQIFGITNNLSLKLKPNNYTLKAYKYGFVENRTEVELTEGEIENISFNLTEKPKVNISGVAYLNGSENHENITIKAIPDGFDWIYENETNSTGHFKINDLYNETIYNLTFEKYGYYPNSTIITTPNNSINVTLYPIPLTNLTGCVNDTEGNPIGGAQIKFENQDNYTGTTNSDGCFKIENVFEIPGKLEINKYEKTPYINKNFNPNTEQNFTLYPVYTIKGKISVKGFSSLNRLIPDLEIKLNQGDKEIESEYTNSNNEFVFTNVYSYDAHNENHTLTIDGIINEEKRFKTYTEILKMNESKETLNIILEVDSTGLIEQESWT